MPGTGVSSAPSPPSRRWGGLPFGGLGLSRLIGNGDDHSVIPDVPTKELPVATQAVDPGVASGQVTMTIGGTKIPAHDPNVVRPRGSHAVASVSSSTEESNAAVGRKLVEVLQGTASVLSGASPEALIRPFVLPTPDKTAQLLTNALAKELLNWERRPEVIVGHGTIGGIFAANVTQGMFEGRSPTTFVPIERNSRTSAEGFNFLCVESEIRPAIQGKRILLAVPILSEQHLAEIIEVRRLIDAEDCAAQVIGVVTIVQYGKLPPTMGDLRVEALLTVAR